MSQGARQDQPAGMGRLGRYTILDRLAEGGMARVYLAIKDGAEEICVLKQLLGEFEKHETAGIRFHREAHIAAHLNHPNIAKVVDAGMEDDKFCIAMEYIAGQTVEDLSRALDKQETILPPTISIAIGANVLDGLAYAHDLRDPGDNKPLQIVHRDLSPRNIMVSYAGEVKIIDFGVAQGRIDNFITAPGMMVGTLRYMAPEQALAESTDHRSDIYTLGVVLYEMLSGKPVVPEGKPVEVLSRVIEEVPPSLIEETPSLPRALSDVITKAIAKSPDDRWQHAGEFGEALLIAAKPLGYATQEHLGNLVRRLFPAKEMESNRWIELGHSLNPELLDEVKAFETISPDQLRATPSPDLVAPVIPNQDTRPLQPASETETDPGDAQTRPDMPSIDLTETDSLGDEQTKISDTVKEPTDSRQGVRARARSDIGTTKRDFSVTRQERLRGELKALQRSVGLLRNAVLALSVLLLVALVVIGLAFTQGFLRPNETKKTSVEMPAKVKEPPPPRAISREKE